jgi:hypothetical protein
MDCDYLTLSKVLASTDYTAFFRGTASDIKNVIDGQLVTFRVVRVWKGDVARETVVYNQMAWVMGNLPYPQQDVSARTFTLGVEYLVATHSDMEKRLREGTTLEGFGAKLGIRGGGFCHQKRFDGPGTSVVLGDAPGYPPK